MNTAHTSCSGTQSLQLEAHTYTRCQDPGPQARQACVAGCGQTVGGGRSEPGSTCIEGLARSVVHWGDAATVCLEAAKEAGNR